MTNPRGPQDENAHGFFVVQCSIASNLKYPPQYADAHLDSLEDAAVMRDILSRKTKFAYAVYSASGQRLPDVGIPNNCDHENAEEVYSDQWTRFFKCPECGEEMQEDR